MFAVLAFGALMGMAIIHLFVFDRIRVRISRDHPEAMKVLSANAWPNRSQPMIAALSDFVWKGRYKALNDQKITSLCRVVKMLTVAILAGLVPVMGLIWQHR